MTLKPIRRYLSPTQAEIDRLVERYAQLRSTRLVSVESGLDRSTVRKYLRERGVRLYERRSMSHSEVQRAVERYEAGKSSAWIGRELGFDNHTILSALRAAGVGIRPQRQNG